MKSLEKLAVVMLAGIVVASVFLATAQADPGKDKGENPNKVKITGTAAGAPVVFINNAAAGTVGPLPLGVTVEVNRTTTVGTGVNTVAFDGGEDMDIDLMAFPGAANSLTAFIFDAPGDQKYHIDGSAGNENVIYVDAAGNDTLDFNGKGGTNTLSILSVLGNNHYKAEKIGPGGFSYAVVPGVGTDKININ